MYFVHLQVNSVETSIEPHEYFYCSRGPPGLATQRRKLHVDQRILGIKLGIELLTS